MKMPNIYREDLAHVMPQVRLSDDVYTQAIAGFIIVCVDAVIVDTERRTFWLAKRCIKPMDGIWEIGGRRCADEEPRKAIRRNFLRETGIDVSEERFKFVTIAEHRWKDRQQEPQNIGCHNIVYQFMVELTSDERGIAATSLDEREYDKEFGLQEFNRERLVVEDVHPLLLDLYVAIFPEH